MTRAGGGRPGLPIAIQLISLLAAGWVITLAVTAAIVLLLPPPAQRVYRVSEVAEALRGGSLDARQGGFLRAVKSDPPPRGEARLSNGIYRFALASALGQPVSRLRIERYPPADPVVRLFARAVLTPRYRSSSPPGAYGAAMGPPGAFGPMVTLNDQAPAPSDRVRAPAPPPSLPGALNPFARSGGAVLLDRFPPLIGDFRVAVQDAAGTWTEVRPKPDAFPNPWQQRLILWFLACFGILTPIGYLFARRLASPIGLFARAAERLGRDPNAPPIEVSGPAEIGLAATAFNEMQARLKRYVEQRTAAIGAMAHDLRTPLARIRFKIDSLPPAVKDGVTRDIIQMEQMIAAALSFVRDATQIRPRELVDLGSAVQCVVDSAALMGGDVKMTGAQPLVVHADGLGLERLFSNLIDNAVKYGRRARVRVYREAGTAVVDICDSGPGLPPSELERVFEPFYRVEPSRSPETGGMGLGLAVSRSIARAHGGDLSLANSRKGLVARVRLPLPPAAGSGPARAAEHALG